MNGDALLRMVVTGPTEPGEGERQLRLRHRQGAWVADSFFGAGFGVVVEDNVYGGDLLDSSVAAIAARPLLVVVLLTEPTVANRRDSERDRPAYRPGRWSADELDPAPRHDTPRLGLWIDDSTQEPEATVEEILSRWVEAIVRPSDAGPAHGAALGGRHRQVAQLVLPFPP